ncbi:Asp-tRNA(Asn) amidotransferase GatCAB subunit C [Candidatus Woesearchaeota archaeon]|nr:Asp-tRNA(Asn) amidotransferase GatCAB subunit C [Candidatus Woesearchaeota archaeon]
MSCEEEIRKEAKKIMDEFVKALEKVKEGEEDVGFELEEDMRSPEAKEKESGFKERMLENAPKKKDGFVVAEKKQW